MAIIRKRKLTDQQSRRIAAQGQKNREVLQPQEDGHIVEGLIVAHYGKQLEVQITDPKLEDSLNQPFPIKQGDIWRCHTRTNLSLMVTGDKVRFIPNTTTGLGVIIAVYERHSLLERPDRYHKLKPVAANVDLIIIVFAPLPQPSAQLIDRYLIACDVSHIKPLLLLNKTDLLPENPKAQVLLDEYAALGIDTLALNVHEDVTPLLNIIAGKNVVFVGQSGVGKSTLINKIAPHAQQRVNIISVGSELGQHTTTTTRFIPIDPLNPQKGALIDSPGIREFGLWHLSDEQIKAGFVEFAPFEQDCQFRNCSHTHEKQCGLKQAKDRGDILPRRLDSLLKLIEENKNSNFEAKI